MEYQRIAAAGLLPVSSTDGVSFGGLVLERCRWWMCGLVFGTLLGPEATGPGRVLLPGACLFLVSWLHRSHGWLLFWRGCVWGVWYGVVV